jgi:hypothetical protein
MMTSNFGGEDNLAIGRDAGWFAWCSLFARPLLGGSWIYGLDIRFVHKPSMFGSAE